MLDHHEDRDPGERTEELPRVELLRIARSLHVSDADVMTRAELRAAIDKARRPEPRPKAQPVTWVSVARRLLASIVEQGLHLPDAAALIRGDMTLSAPPKAPPPVATVTLARIYAAQGHLVRAIGTLDEVLATDTDHDLARELREQLQRQLTDLQNKSASQRPPEPAPAHEEEVDERPTTIDPIPASPVVGSPVASSPVVALEVQPTPADVSAPPAEMAPPSVDAPPPSVDVAPPSSVDAPPISAAVPSVPPAVERAPRTPELIVIETGEACAYVYWELPWPQTGAPYEPHWISVVAHTPAPFGCDREERRYPVTHDSGALRVQGLPKAAIVRAKLTRGAEPSSRPLAVASAVRASFAVTPENGRAASAPEDERALEPRFTPHSRANPKALADRALSRVDAASPAYW